MSNRFDAGRIVLIDWRNDALPKEPNKLRPCIIVQDHALFDPTFPTLLVVPLAESSTFLIPSLIVTIDPTAENGCTKRCYAVSHSVRAASKRRLQSTTGSRITSAQLAQIRLQIAEHRTRNLAKRLSSPRFRELDRRPRRIATTGIESVRWRFCRRFVRHAPERIVVDANVVRAALVLQLNTPQKPTGRRPRSRGLIARAISRDEMPRSVSFARNRLDARPARMRDELRRRIHIEALGPRR